MRPGRSRVRADLGRPFCCAFYSMGIAGIRALPERSRHLSYVFIPRPLNGWHQGTTSPTSVNLIQKPQKTSGIKHFSIQSRSTRWSTYLPTFSASNRHPGGARCQTVVAKQERGMVVGRTSLYWQSAWALGTESSCRAWARRFARECVPAIRVQAPDGATWSPVMTFRDVWETVRAVPAAARRQCKVIAAITTAGLLVWVYLQVWPVVSGATHEVQLRSRVSQQIALRSI